MDNLIFQDEVWKDIPLWEGFYQVSNLGRVRSLDRIINNHLYAGKILNQYLNNQGYYYVCFSKNQKYKKYLVLQLVARTFIGNVENCAKNIWHKNGNKSDNRVENITLEPRPKNIDDGPRMCKTCKNLKPVTEFYIEKTGRVNVNCKICARNEKKNFARNNPEKTKAINKKHYWKHKDKRLAAHKRWYQLNKKEINRKNELKNQQRAKTDPNYKMRRICKTRLYNAFKYRGLSKNHQSCLDFIGCTVDELRKHIESQFTKDMTWENYGKNGWHLGHILPCELFDFTDELQVKQCFHYSNLRPELGDENITAQDLLSDGRYARNLTKQERLQYIADHYPKLNSQLNLKVAS